MSLIHDSVYLNLNKVEIGFKLTTSRMLIILHFEQFGFARPMLTFMSLALRTTEPSVVLGVTYTKISSALRQATPAQSYFLT